MPPPRGLVQWLDHALHNDPLWPPRARLLVAVSGGADSVALLRLLHALNPSRHWQCHLIVAHIDHGLRGKESAADARFVRALARSLRLPFLLKKLKLPRAASEDAARTSRLAAFTKLARAHKAQGILLAHHADDHAETVLLKLFRGTGLDGLAGIQRRSIVNGLTLYRPLLDLRRSDLRAYLASVDQSFREDATNASTHFTRNRLRLELLPHVQAFSPHAVPALRRMSRIVDDARQLIRDTAHTVWQAEANVSKTRVVFPRLALRTWNALAAELLRHAIDHVGGSSESADHERLLEALRLIKNPAGGKIVQMGEGVLVRVGKEVIIERIPQRRRRA